MRRLFSRGLMLLMVLALMVPTVSGVSAQSATADSEIDILTLPVEPVEAPPVLMQVGSVSESMIRVTDGTCWGYSSLGGTILIPVQFDAAEDFKLGVAKVTLNGKVGLLHWSGSFLLAPEYDELTEVGYGLYLGKRGGVWDLLSTASVSTKEGTTHVLYSDLSAASVSTGTNG